MPDATISGAFSTLDSKRQGHLEKARECARLSIPTLLAQEERNHSTRASQSQWIADNYQSDVADGVSTLAGKSLQSIHAPGMLWAQHGLSPKIEFDQSIDEQVKEELRQGLFARSMIVLSTLESSTGEGGNDHTRGFHSARRNSLQQLFVCGDVLERLDDDYQMTTFRLDQYVTERDSTGRVLRHIVKERYDAASLDPSERRAADLADADLLKTDVSERMSDVYTKIEWQPIAKKWTLTKELLYKSGAPKIIDTRDEKISPYFSTPYDLPPGEHYGESRVMLYMGDCAALDNIAQRELDFAFLASWFKLFIDEAWGSSEADIFESRNGSAHRGPLRQDGSPAHIALFKADKLADFQVVSTFKQERVANIRRAFLSASGQIRDAERTTALEVTKVIAELQAALGGVYATIADSLQRPLFDRAHFQCVRDKILFPFPKHLKQYVQTRALTGLKALAEQAEFQNVMSLVRIAAELGPQAQARLKMGPVLNLAVRSLSINKPNLIMTEQEAKDALQEAMQLQLQQKAGERGIDAAGTIAEQRAANTPGA